MKDNRVEADSVKETETVSKFVQLVEHCATNLDDGKFGGVGGVRRRRKDTQVAFDLSLGTNGIEQPGDCVLGEVVASEMTVIWQEHTTHPVRLCQRLQSSGE